MTLDLDEELRPKTFRSDVCRDLTFEVNSWRMVGSTSPLYAFVILGPDWFSIGLSVGLLLWSG
jgi:hypothetical protein